MKNLSCKNNTDRCRFLNGSPWNCILLAVPLKGYYDEHENVKVMPNWKCPMVLMHKQWSKNPEAHLAECEKKAAEAWRMFIKSNQKLGERDVQLSEALQELEETKKDEQAGLDDRPV